MNQDFYYYTLGECANFVSQCLLAGGYEMYGNSDIDGWHYYNENNASESWRLADNQFRYFRDSDYTLSELIINKNNYQNLNNTITTYNIRIGDLIYMDFESDGKIDHAAIINRVENGEIFYSAHTADRFDQNLYSAIDSSTTIYILRMK